MDSGPAVNTGQHTTDPEYARQDTPKAEIKAQGGSNSAALYVVNLKFRIPAKMTMMGGGILHSSQIIKEPSLLNSDLVGTAGFEPATPCTPCKCATRLRHAPSAEKYTAS